MSDDLNKLARMAADLMEKIEESYGSDVELRTIAIAVEVDAPRSTHCIINCSDDRSWVQAAFLERALDVVDATLHGDSGSDDD